MNLPIGAASDPASSAGDRHVEAGRSWPADSQPTRPTGSFVADVLLAVVLGAVGLVLTRLVYRFVDPGSAVDVGAQVLVAATALALAARRHLPLLTLTAVTTMTTAYLVIGYPFGPILVLFSVAVYTMARYRPPADAVPAALGALVLLLLHLFTDGATGPGVAGVIPGSAWVVVPFALGFTVRLTAEAAERGRAEQARLRADDERLRVAQEVHDVMGHGLMAIKMQADVALHLLPKKPQQAELALGAISRTSSEALEELRATLGAFRRGDAEAPRAPVPGLARLDDLRRRVTGAGVAVRIETTGEPRPLPAAADVVAYRVVQESLTNVLRHSGADVATVGLDYAADAVVVTVSNPAARRQGSGLGLGIPGMRRRVESLGGEFECGPLPDGTYEVRARLPAGPSRASR